MKIPYFIEAGDDAHATGVIFPDFLGFCLAFDDVDDIESQIKRAVLCYFRLLIEDGEDIPSVTPVGEVDVAEYKGMVIGELVIPASEIDALFPKK